MLVRGHHLTSPHLTSPHLTSPQLLTITMNDKKAKVLRRAARALAAQKPDLHSQNRYHTIVREWFAPNPKQPGAVGRFFRKLLRKKLQNDDICVRREFQDVLSAGPQFIYRRLKAALERGEIRVNGRGPTARVETVS